MCGTVGMFVGCAALTYCPKALLTGGRVQRPASGEVGAERAEQVEPEVAGTELAEAGPAGSEEVKEEVEDPGYRSPFRGWYERASVRRAPRRMVSEADAALKFFSPDLVPVAGHPLVKALPERVFGELLIQHLYRYLDFTAQLEYLVVNRTVLGLAHGTVGLRLPEEMRFDALKMYCDEAYHALFSVDLQRQVKGRTGVAPVLPAEPFFLRRLQQILEELPSSDKQLAELLFVIVSETLISASLAELPDTDEVVPAVREAIRDHATDEGRHHAYFATLLRHLWAQSDRQERRRIGVLVPRLMDAFLRPDLDALKGELATYGLSRDEAEQVAAEVYSPEVVGAHSRATSRMTRRYFESAGAFAIPEAVDQLAVYGFVE
ncbi:diiron oxygenase [Kitasatospora sp. NPDC096147]|uniref:diiron oxygenase n=1 Tax=Kitasatospora sp. NPDC096147 TaxID=3364093 RepID=UPI003801300E